MTHITNQIPDTKVPKFIKAFKQDYDQRVAEGELEGVTELQYAKRNATRFLADRANAVLKQMAQNERAEVDITK